MDTSALPPPRAAPPVTLEGWYALHQACALDRRALRSLPPARRRAAACIAGDALADAESPGAGGWSLVVRLIGSSADVLFIHFRPTLDALAGVQRALARLELLACLRPTLALLGITEVGLYHATGGADDGSRAARVEAERTSPHTLRRLHPERPVMPYAAFYPMSRRSEAAQNWYTLPLDERSRLMHEHGLTGRRYAGRLSQIITGATGLAAWEWGVTLFAADPLVLKHVVADMRHDEASARYARFGGFHVGRVMEGRRWALSLAD